MHALISLMEKSLLWRQLRRLEEYFILMLITLHRNVTPPRQEKSHSHSKRMPSSDSPRRPVLLQVMDDICYAKWPESGLAL